MSLNVEVSGAVASPTSSEVNEVVVQGGGGAEKTFRQPLSINSAGTPFSLRQPLSINSAETPFGVEHFTLLPENAKGEAEHQAGAHPFQFSTSFSFNQIYYPFPSPPPAISPTTPALTRALRV